jgi:hypothetical protein
MKKERWYAIEHEEHEVVASANTLPKLQDAMDAIAQIIIGAQKDISVRKPQKNIKFIVARKQMVYVTPESSR